ncbi:lysosomal protein transmembrane 5 [Ictidomys tridecemlineatus]|uniref:lysosomal-associated transmembrane protein 5 n=1 Tax=Ictidomys tridecemlineatus TaxID=43179 RepID=UPI00038BF38E|nr:lysosomal-associated transmembrane protein 5 [Ictidomys tridecemlineatus]KAG3282572.1 lysosomal protein transmembrane 5 [Ictidomys tridecemlineatus]
MAPRAAPIRQTCCCFNVRVVTTALAIYHVIMSVLLFVEHTVEVARGKASCRFSKTVYLRIADLVSSFLLIGLLFLISLSLLLGVVKVRGTGREGGWAPGVPLPTLHLCWAVQSAAQWVGAPQERPASPHVSFSAPVPGPSKVPLMTLQLLDFCLSILTLCSSYMEVPTYLNFKSMNHMNYFPSQEGLAHSQFIRTMVIFSVAFVTVLVLKVYMLKCVWRCYRLLKSANSAEERGASKTLPKVVLPTYEEALSLPSKSPEGDPAPPPYSEV